jgi:hypothetical protein
MGFRLNVDLETGSGPTQEAYVRIDNYRFNKVTSEIILTTTTWLSVEKAHAFNRKYLDENLKNAEGLVSQDVLYYDSPDSEGEEIKIPIIFKASTTQSEEIEFPVFEERESIEEVPYVSFDENGDEITKYKSKVVKKKVVVDNYIETKEVIKPELLENLYEFSYSVVKKELAELFPEDKIEKI